MLKDILRSAGKFATDNTAGILTGLGVAGAVSTALLSGRAMFRIGLDANAQHYEKQLVGEEVDPHFLDTNVLLKTYWRELIPPAIVGGATIVVIIAANRVSAKRAAALAAAFKISEEMANEYRQKVVDSIGKNAEEKIRADVSKDRMERVSGEVIIVDGNNCLFFDEFSGRFFESSVQKVDNAVNQINNQINQSWCASLTEFYDLLGLPKSEMSDEFGWNSNELLEVYKVAVMKDDTQQPAIGIRYNTQPFRYFNKIG